MKLLLDQNLSHRLIGLLRATYPESEYVRNVGLALATDREIWDFAASNRFAIVSKDVDFQQRALLLSHPPKVIWLRLGNRKTSEVMNLFSRHRDALADFAIDASASFIALG